MTPSDGNSLRAFWVRFFTQWVAEGPGYASTLDKLDGLR